MSLAMRIFVAVVLAVVAAPVSAQTLRTIAGNRQLGSQNELNVRVQFAAGHLVIGRDDTGMLYRAKVVYDEERFEPLLDYSSGDHTLTLGVEGLKGVRGKDGDGVKQELRLDVSPKVPVRFDIKFGAAEADVDLGGLNLVRAEVNTGATDAKVRFSSPTTGRCQELTIHVGAASFRAEQLGNSRCRTITFMGGVADLALDLTGDWGDVTAANIDVGVGMGSLTLRLPKDVGVEVEIARFLASFDRSGFVKRDGAYYSPNYDAAKSRIHLNVKTALGAVEVEWR